MRLTQKIQKQVGFYLFNLIDLPDALPEEDDEWKKNKDAADKLKDQLKKLFKGEDDDPMAGVKPSGHMLKKGNQDSEEVRDFLNFNGIGSSRNGGPKKNKQSGNTEKLEPVHNFGDDSETEMNTPWWSIELIFNRSNIWANMRNFKPTSIYYHLHEPDHWFPFLWNLEGKNQKIHQNFLSKINKRY